MDGWMDEVWVVLFWKSTCHSFNFVGWWTDTLNDGPFTHKSSPLNWIYHRKFAKVPSQGWLLKCVFGSILCCGRPYLSRWNSNPWLSPKHIQLSSTACCVRDDKQIPVESYIVALHCFGFKVRRLNVGLSRQIRRSEMTTPKSNTFRYLALERYDEKRMHSIYTDIHRQCRGKYLRV